MPYDQDDDCDQDDGVLGVNTDAAARWEGEDLTVDFSGRNVLSDYGVPGSPIFCDIEDVEITGLAILGIAVDPRTLSRQLHDRLIQLADDVEWEQG